MDLKYQDFKEKLDREHKWPCTYMFKFIVPKSAKNAIPEVFPNDTIQIKESKGGKYISYTIEKIMESSEAVIEVYEEVHKIEGVIAL